MNLKTAETFLVACIILFLAVAVWIGIRNLSYFDIHEIEVSFSGPVEKMSDDMSRCITPYKGLNLFKSDLKYLENTLLKFEGVKNVTIKRFFPNKLIVKIDFADYMTKVFFTENGESFFYLADREGMIEVSQETFNLYSQLSSVEIKPEYAYLVLKWGVDNGFIQMCNLARELSSKTLITYIKYDNNNSNNFGLMTVELDNLNADLFVREPVMPQRLSDALDLIARDTVRSEKRTRFDLYSTALVKRK